MASSIFRFIKAFQEEMYNFSAYYSANTEHGRVTIFCVVLLLTIMQEVYGGSPYYCVNEEHECLHCLVLVFCGSTRRNAQCRTIQ